MADITGPGFLIALSQKNALELGLEEINSSGGLLGRRMELIMRDSQMKPDLAARQTQELIVRDKVDFIVGPTSPSVALAVSNVCKEHKKLLCLHSANNERLNHELGHRYVFSVVPNTYMEGQALAAFLAKRGFKKILIIGPDLEYGRSQAGAFKRRSLKSIRQLPLSRNSGPALENRITRPTLPPYWRPNRIWFVPFSGEAIWPVLSARPARISFFRRSPLPVCSITTF